MFTLETTGFIFPGTPGNVVNLKVVRLIGEATNEEVIAALGGNPSRVEITITQFFRAFATQPDCEAAGGLIPTNGSSTVGFVRIGGGDEVVAMFGYASEFGWQFNTRPRESLERWLVGERILLPNT